MELNDSERKERLLTGSYLLVTLLNFLVGCTIFIQASYLPVYVLELGKTKADVGLIIGTFALTALLTRPVAGYLLDRIGRFPVVFLGSCLLALDLVLYLFVDSYLKLFLVRILNGIAFSFVSTTAITLIVDVTAESRLKEGIGYFAVSGTIASAVGPALGLIIFNRGGFRPLFFLISLFGLGILFTSLKLGRKIRPRPGEIGGTDSKVRKSPFQLKMFYPALFIMFMGCSLGLLFTYIPVLGVERNIQNVSLFFTFYALAITALRFLGSQFIDRIGSFAQYTLAVLLQCLAILMLGMAVSLNVVLLAGALFGFAFAINQPLLNLMQIDVMPDDRKGLAGAIYFIALDSGFSAGAIGFGVLLERWDFFPVFALCAGLLFVSLFLYWLIFVKKQKENIL
jgi:predicted MFS family arabinose efflux permease